jgi:hypothetical protein
MRTLACAVVTGFALAGMAWAGGDKAQTPFADTSSIDGGSNGFSNGISSGSAKTTGCTTQIKFKGLSGINAGDQVICIGSADVRAAALGPNPAGNSVVWQVPALLGAIKIKSSVAIIDVGGNHCGSTKVVSLNASTQCYKPDPGYNPATACGTVPAIWIAAPANTTGLLGLCQGVNQGDRIPPPSSGKIAETAQTILVGAK